MSNEKDDIYKSATIDEAPWDDGKTAYEHWCEDQKIPIERGFFIDDLTKVRTSYWDRLGVDGAIVDLEGTAESNGAYLLRINSGDATSKLKHLFEMVVYVVEGEGITEVSTGRDITPCRWQRGSVFAVPINSTYRHVAVSKSVLYCVHTAPLVMNLFHNETFVNENSFEFTDRFNGEEGFFSTEGEFWRRRGKKDGGVIFETNFVLDVTKFELHEVPSRGRNNRGILFQLGENTLIAHISEFPPGMYKKAHRHGPGAHVVILDGEGYSFLWQNDLNERKIIEWQRNSVFVPPNFWWHQHFNVSNIPARYLAIRWGPLKHRLDHGYDQSSTDQSAGGNQISYEQQDPEIDKFFREQCIGRGVQPRMPEHIKN